MSTKALNFVTFHLPSITTERLAIPSGEAVEITTEVAQEQLAVKTSYMHAIEEELRSTKYKFYLTGNLVILSLSLYLITPYGLIPLLIIGAFLTKHSAHLVTLMLLRLKKKYE